MFKRKTHSYLSEEQYQHQEVPIIWFSKDTIQAVHCSRISFKRWTKYTTRVLTVTKVKRILKIIFIRFNNSDAQLTREFRAISKNKWTPEAFYFLIMIHKNFCKYCQHRSLMKKSLKIIKNAQFVRRIT